MKMTMKGVFVSTLCVITSVAGLAMTANDAAAQMQQRSSNQELVDRPAADRLDPGQPAEFSTVEPIRREEGVNETGSELPADNPWITHCLTEHDAGEDFDNCLKDGGL